MKDYFVGLDIGTESIGWAVTDADYQIQKKNGIALWGVRLFPEAQRAEDRRSFRTARRRLERRKQRIEWLRQVFSEEIAKVDPAFFMRLDESKFDEADKKLGKTGTHLGRYTLFADRHYCDVDYHKEFPTIYHLRKALMTNDRSFDVRLVYLAVHHILKKRGHFLFGDMGLADITFESCIKELCDCLLNQYELNLDIADLSQFKSVLINRTFSITRKKAELKKLINVSKEEKQLSAIMDLLAGAKVKSSDVCGVELAKEDDISFTFKGDFDSVEPQLRELLSDDMQLIDLVKKLYDWALLEELRNGEKYISFAKVSVYEQHLKDLKRLKQLFKADKKLFNEMFRVAKDKLNNYPAYSGHGSANYHCDYDAFCKYTKAQIKVLLPKLDKQGQNEANQIIDEMDACIFLPKQTNKDNGVIPHQLHEQELRQILEKAETYLPFLRERDESGLSRSEQILAVFRFRIPYYVGPLNAKSEHSWLVRTEEKITPWNFEKVVDLNASAEKFIERMTATCSYIGEAVLPKDSLLYSKFIVLNAINKLQINGQSISVALKQQIYNQHILVQGRVTGKSIKNYMLSNGLMKKNDTFGGIDESFKAALTGWQVFRQMLARGNTYLMVEDIIRHIVLYGEDRKLLERWLAQEYGEHLSAADIGYILRNRTRFGGWGSLSKEFLTKIEHVDGETGEVISIIDALWNTNHNLMELLSGRFTFTQSIEIWREQKYCGKKQTIDDVLKDSYASPGIRRAIRQTMSLISEIEKIMGGTPRRVFVEVTRSEGAKERTVSRKKRLEELYAFCKKEAAEVYDHLLECDEAALRSTKLYLYFTQMGKCMYSGDPIDLSRPWDYDIDHIYPRSKVKDDSLNNLVLVKKSLNEEKSNSYPISENIRNNMKPFWAGLKAKKLISEEKYRRLTRNTSFDDEELSGFIARQLVETSQACKIVAELLKNRYEGSDRVVYVKAGNVSSFRQDQRILPDGTRMQASACAGVNTKQDPLFVKCRDVNDFHHAKDAYLNIVVGNVYHVKFTRNPINFIREKHTYSLNRMFDFDVIRNGEYAWHKGEAGSIAIVRRMMAKNNILFTRYAHEATGGLFDQQIVSKGNGQAMIKKSDPRMTTEKFGGYNKLTGAYFMLVEHTEKKKRIRSIETVFLMDKTLYERNPVAYCTQILGLTDPKILIRKIKMDSLVEYDGFRMRIASRSNDNIFYNNANQLVVSPLWQQYIKETAKYHNTGYTNREITAEKNLELYDLLLDKLVNTLYRTVYETPIKHLTLHRHRFIELDIYRQSGVLMEVLNLFRTTGLKANLKEIDAAKTGQISVTKRISTLKGRHLYIINQSVTGFFEQKTDLLGDKF